MVNTGCFGVEERYAVGSVQRREHGEHEENNAEAANPLHFGTPQQDSFAE